MDVSSLPEVLRKLPGDTQAEEDSFHHAVLQFGNGSGTPGKATAKLGGVEVNLAKLLKEVVNRNGSAMVTHKRKWKEVAVSLGINKGSVSTTIKKAFETHLQVLEKRLFNFPEPDVPPQSKTAQAAKKKPSAAPSSSTATSEHGASVQQQATKQDQSTGMSQGPAVAPYVVLTSPSQLVRPPMSVSPGPSPARPAYQVPPRLPAHRPLPQQVASTAASLNGVTHPPPLPGSSLPTTSDMDTALQLDLAKSNPSVVARNELVERVMQHALEGKSGTPPPSSATASATPTTAMTGPPSSMMAAITPLPQSTASASVSGSGSASLSNKRKRTKAEEVQLQKELHRKHVMEAQQKQQQQHAQLSTKDSAERKQQLENEAKHGAVRKELEDQMAPTLGPFLVLPAQVKHEQVLQLCMALYSGYPPQVNWALNLLTVLSFEDTPEFNLSDNPGVLDALLQVLARGAYSREEESLHLKTCSSSLRVRGGVMVGDDDDEDCVLSRMRRHDGGGASSSGRDVWADDGGALAPPPGELDHFTWAVCASNIIRNLSCVPSNAAWLSSAPVVNTLVTCLDAARDLQGPGGNELRANLLDGLKACGPHIHMETLEQGGATLMELIITTLKPGAAPLHLQAATAGVLGSLLNNNSSAAVWHHVEAQWRSQLLDNLLHLMLSQRSTARQAVQNEVDGASYVDHMRSLKQHKGSGLAVEAMAAVVHADAVAAAAQTYAELMLRGGDRWRVAIARHWQSMKALVQLGVGLLPLESGSANDPNRSLTRYIDGNISKARDMACHALHAVALHPDARNKLLPFESKIAVAAMSGGPTSKQLAPVLGSILYGRAPPHRPTSGA